MTLIHIMAWIIWTKIAFCKKLNCRQFFGFSTIFEDIFLLLLCFFFNLPSVIIVIFFPALEPALIPAYIQWVTSDNPLFVHAHICSSHWSGSALVTTFNFSVSSIPLLPCSTSTIFLLVTSRGTRLTRLSRPRSTCSPLATRRHTGKTTERTQRT